MTVSSLTRKLVCSALFCLSLSVLEACFAQDTPATASQTQNSAKTSDSPTDPLQRPRAKKKKSENAYKTWVDEVKLIITPEEMAAFRRLTNDSERANFVEIFWQHRDPTPDTEENEYKEEFHRRLAYADEHFAAGKAGRDTDRGKMYIIHGPPDSIDAHPSGGPYQRTAEEGGGQTSTYPFEVWRYRNLDGIGQEIEIEFVDSCGCGDYHMTLDRGEKDALVHVPGAGPTDAERLLGVSKAARFSGGPETLGPSLFGANRDTKEFDRIMQQALLSAPPPVKYGLREDVHVTFRYNLLPFNVRVDFLRASADTALVPITVRVANKDLAFEGKDGVEHASVNIYGRLTTMTGKVAQTFDEPLRLNVPTGQVNFGDKDSMYQVTEPLKPGRYRLDVVLKDAIGNKTGISSQAIEVPDFDRTDGLSASTLVLADMMTPVASNDIGKGSFVLGNMKVRPRMALSREEAPVFTSVEKIHVWMEAYKLAVDGQSGKASAMVRYQVMDEVSKAKIVDQSEQMDSAAKQITIKETLPDKLTPGVYQLKVMVKDQVSGQGIEREAKFVVK